jgi:hypothetical protein
MVVHKKKKKKNCILSSSRASLTAPEQRQRKTVTLKTNFKCTSVKNSNLVGYLSTPTVFENSSLFEESPGREKGSLVLFLLQIESQDKSQGN